MRKEISTRVRNSLILDPSTLTSNSLTPTRVMPRMEREASFTAFWVASSQDLDEDPTSSMILTMAMGALLSRGDGL